MNHKVKATAVASIRDQLRIWMLSSECSTSLRDPLRSVRLLGRFLESRREQKPAAASNDLAIDTRPIINPDAFKYLEKRQDSFSQSNEGSGIDAKPIVNPDAFRYLEQRNIPARRDVDAGVDTSSRINPNAFQYIEKNVVPKPDLTESTIDYRPIVNPQAFKWIERKEPPRPVDDGPEVDERSYVNPQAFQYVDRRPGKLSDVCEPEIDTRSFILDRNPKALAHLEREPIERQTTDEPGGIDERSYVNPQSFRYLEGMANESPTVRVHSSAVRRSIRSLMSIRIHFAISKPERREQQTAVRVAVNERWMNDLTSRRPLFAI